MCCELARAEALVGDQAAVSHYEEAIGLATDPGLRALLKHELSHLYFLAGHWERGLALLQRAVAELETASPNWRLGLRPPVRGPSSTTRAMPGSSTSACRGWRR